MARRLLDAGLWLLAVSLFLALGLALFIGWDLVDRLRYDRVEARVRTVEASCLLEWPPPSRPAAWESTEPRRSDEMACAAAAAEAPAERARVVERLTVTYSYTSPRNGRLYSGRLQRDAADFPPDVRPGGRMPVYALKSDPARSRGLYQWPLD